MKPTHWNSPLHTRDQLTPADNPKLPSRARSTSDAPPISGQNRRVQVQSHAPCAILLPSHSCSGPRCLSTGGQSSVGPSTCWQPSLSPRMGAAAGSVTCLFTLPASRLRLLTYLPASVGRTTQSQGWIYTRLCSNDGKAIILRDGA